MICKTFLYPYSLQICAFLCLLFFIYIPQRYGVFYSSGICWWYYFSRKQFPSLCRVQSIFKSLFSDQGPKDLKYFIGIEVIWAPRGLFLCQRKYALEVAEESNLLGSKPIEFPMEENHKLTLVNCKVTNEPSRYRRLVGRLIYLTITRPKLCYAVHILPQFMQEPKEEHIDVARRFLLISKELQDMGSCCGQTVILQFVHTVMQTGLLVCSHDVLSLDIFLTLVASRFLRKQRNRQWCLVHLPKLNIVLWP